MRITTALNRLLRLRGASVIDVSISVEAIIVTVRPRRPRQICAICGQTGRHLQIDGRRVKRWHHLDLGSARCVHVDDVSERRGAGPVRREWQPHEPRTAGAGVRLPN